MRFGKSTALAAIAAFSLFGLSGAQAGAMRAGFDTTTMFDNDDGSTALISFGFASAIDFNGVDFTGGFVNNNGNMTLTSPLGTFTPSAITAGTSPIFAPFFADVDTRSRTGAAQPTRYGEGAVGVHDAFGITWLDVGYFAVNYGQLNSFQFVLIDRSDVAVGDFDFEFNIDTITWESGEASGSDSEGLGGTSAAMGWSNGAGSFYQQPGSLVNGAFLDSGPAATALIHNERNSSLSDGGLTDGRYFFEVRNGTVQPPVTTDIPEPFTLSLLGAGLAGIAMARRKRA